MSSGKISGSNPFHHVRISDAPPASQDPALHHASHGHFKGALFRHGGPGILMRRGPVGRMPLRSAGTKRKTGAKRNANLEGVTDLDFLQDEDTHVIEDSSAELLVRRINAFQKQEDPGSDREDGGERRFARMFQLPVAEVNSASGFKSTGTSKEAKQAALASVPLPAMRSLGDVVKFIHSCTEKDPTGKSVSQILRRINAAVLRKEIDLPVVTKVADARTVLIEIFGAAQMSRGTASLSMRNIHALLPLWLVNLGRQRSSEQRVQAAARVSSQRAALDMK